MKIQAPVGLITWYLFRNRPFKMWPLEDAIEQLLKVNPAIYGGITAAAYLSCKAHCEYECPYLDGSPRDRETNPYEKELEAVDASDRRVVSRFMAGGARRRGGGGGAGGGFGDSLSEFFRIV